MGTQNSQISAGDRNQCRGQAPWAWRYRVIGLSLTGAACLFGAALVTGQSDAFVPLAGFAGTVVSANIAGAVVEDCWRPRGPSTPMSGPSNPVTGGHS